MSTLLVDFMLAFRNCMRHRRRTAVAVVAVAFGIAASIVANGFVEWMLLTFREEAIQFLASAISRSLDLDTCTRGIADPYSFSAIWAASPKLQRSTIPVGSRLSHRVCRSTGCCQSQRVFPVFHRRRRESGQQRRSSKRGAARRGPGAVAGRSACGYRPGVGLARDQREVDRLVVLANTASGGTTPVEAARRWRFSTISKAR